MRILVEAFESTKGIEDGEEMKRRDRGIEKSLAGTTGLGEGVIVRIAGLGHRGGGWLPG